MSRLTVAALTAAALGALALVSAGLAQEAPAPRDLAPAAPGGSVPAAPPASDGTAAAPVPPPVSSSPAAPAAPDVPDARPAAKAQAEPPADKTPPEPLKRPRYPSAILQGVDKITAETLRFEVKVGEPVRYKGLILTVHACETTAPDEAAADSVAHLEVQSQPIVLQGRAAAPPRLVFRGWMFASSPTLHPFEHPVYDLWLIACKTSGPTA